MAESPRSSWQCWALHNYNPGHDKFYVVRIDLTTGANPYRVIGAWGPVARAQAQSEKCYDEFDNLISAQDLARQLMDGKEKGGYINVESHRYDGGSSFAELIAKVPQSCIVGKANNGRPTMVDSGVGTPPARKGRRRRPVETTEPGEGRALRVIG